MAERRAIAVEEERERPAITAARLDRMFDGLRYEVTALRMPPSQEVVVRAVRRRRRRRAEIVALTGALASVGVWGLTTFCLRPPGDVAGLAGLPVERTITPTLLLPGPVEATGRGGEVDEAMPLSATGDELLLGLGGLPVRSGLYGPWGPQRISASSFAMPVVKGCVPGMVELSGAARRWELVHEDEAGTGTLAVQYLLEFDDPTAAGLVEQRLLGASECTVPGAGWVAGERTHRAVALRTFGTPGSGPERAEEVTVRLSGRQVAVLLVQYSADPTPTGLAGGVLDPEFRAASEAFAGLPVPARTRPPSAPASPTAPHGPDRGLSSGAAAS